MSYPKIRTDFAQIPSPCYVLDQARLRENLELLRRVQREAGVKIICALKGFSFWRAFPQVRRYLPGATASSLHEAMLASSEMGGELHVYAPAYGDDDGGYMNGASYYYCKEPRRAFAVITLSAGASRTVALQEASTSSTNDYRHIAVFRAPDPTYASPGIAEAGWGVV